MGVASSSFFEPIDPLEGRVFDLVELPPRAPGVNDLGLVQPDDRLGERVVIGIADAARPTARYPLPPAAPSSGSTGAPLPRSLSCTTPSAPERDHNACSSAS